MHVIQGKNNEHFHKSISATAFINSCEYLQITQVCSNHLDIRPFHFCHSFFVKVIFETTLRRFVLKCHNFHIQGFFVVKF